MRRVFLRWLTHRSRVPRRLRAVLAVTLGAAWVVGLAAPSSPAQSPSRAQTASSAATGTAAPTKSPLPPGAGNPSKSFPDSPALRAEGFTLYQESCSSCHGIALNGTPGVAPSLRGVGPGPVDFYLSTGRMPLEQPREEPLRNAPAFTRPQIDALIAYISSFGGP
ncbi:MAG: cytochrome c, partial [Solirubrobacterales bacterium]|nr:cytochrome c [Solirubrobacterales bacterium]